MARICIDPGHGGHDSGAVGPTGLKESQVNLDISHRVAQELEEMGHKILMTRSTEEFVEINERCRIANSWYADYFCSIHCNSDGPEAEGIETLYVSETGKELSSPIQEALIFATGDVDRGLKHRTNLGVLNGTHMPATLTEIGFISHPETEKKFKTAEYKTKVATAIATGLNQTADED